MSQPADVSLAVVYDLDVAMGGRTEDLQMWADLLSGLEAVVEVGCGNGRLQAAMSARGLPCAAHWVGIDSDPDMTAEFRSRTGCPAVVGRAQDTSTWDDVHRVVFQSPWSQPIRAAIVPFSTLYLVPHGEQRDVLALASTVVASGGIVAVECFIPEPSFMRSCERVQLGGCRGPAGDPTADRWCRESTFVVDGPGRTTHVERLYGPAGDRRYRVCETIHWRDPIELIGLGELAGLHGCVLRTTSDDHTIPRGSALLVGTAR